MEPEHPDTQIQQIENIETIDVVPEDLIEALADPTGHKVLAIAGPGKHNMAEVRYESPLIPDHTQGEDLFTLPARAFVDNQTGDVKSRLLRIIGLGEHTAQLDAEVNLA